MAKKNNTQSRVRSWTGLINAVTKLVMAVAILTVVIALAL